MKLCENSFHSNFFIFSIWDALNPKKAASLAEIRPEHINKMMIANKPILTFKGALATSTLQKIAFPQTKDEIIEGSSKHESIYSRVK